MAILVILRWSGIHTIVTSLCTHVYIVGNWKHILNVAKLILADYCLVTYMFVERTALAFW